MHWFLLVVSFLLMFAAAANADPNAAPETVTPPTSADAKPSTPSEAKELSNSRPAGGEPKTTTMSPAEIRAKSDTYFRQCLNDWDAATHMTKKEWQRTCRRITDERAKFEEEQLGKYPSLLSEEALPRPDWAVRRSRAPTE